MGSSSHSDLIRNIQIKLREGAGVPGYDPSNPAFRFRPEREEIWSGSALNRERFPDSISFNSTEAYRRLLRCLDLNGSEIVSTKAKPENSRENENVEDGIRLSEYLNIELKRQIETDEERMIKPANEPVQTTQILNASGIDLDNYFSDNKKEDDSNFKDVDLFEKSSSVQKSLLPVESGENDDIDPVPKLSPSILDPLSEDLIKNFPSPGEKDSAKVPFEIPPVSDSWPLDDLWPSTSSTMLANSLKLEAEEDLFDEWQDFSGSRNVQGSGLSHPETAEKSEEVNIGEFFQYEEDPSVSNAMHEQALFPEGIINQEYQGKAQDSTVTVDMLLAEMHDLSFMLEDGLSLSGDTGPYGSSTETSDRKNFLL